MANDGPDHHLADHLEGRHLPDAREPACEMCQANEQFFKDLHQLGTEPGGADWLIARARYRAVSKKGRRS
jgi:hypothetical protein